MTDPRFPALDDAWLDELLGPEPERPPVSALLSQGFDPTERDEEWEALFSGAPQAAEPLRLLSPPKRDESAEQAWLDHSRFREHSYVSSDKRNWRTAQGEAALREGQWVKLNTKQYVNFLVVDLDFSALISDPHARAMDRIEGAGLDPAWVTLSDHGAHVGWFLDPVGTWHYRSMRYALAVRRNLTKALGGDMGYSNWSTRNPLFSGAETYWLHSNVHQLGTLKALVGERWTNGLQFGSAARGEGRNSTLYTACRLAITAGRVNSESDLHNLAQAANDELEDPLDPADVVVIARSAWKGASGMPAPQAHIDMARRGGQSRSETKIGSSTARIDAVNQGRLLVRDSRDPQIWELRMDGLSQTAIAAKLGCGLSTVRRSLKRMPSELIENPPTDH